MVASIEESLKRFEAALDRLQAAVERRVGEGSGDGGAERDAALAGAETQADRLREVHAELTLRIGALIEEVRTMIGAADADGKG